MLSVAEALTRITAAFAPLPAETVGLTGALGGVGNVGGDPLFVDPIGPDTLPGTEDDDLRLQSGSPCIDAADNTAVPPDDTDLDEDGDVSERLPLDLDGTPRFVKSLERAYQRMWETFVEGSAPRRIEVAEG